MATLRRGLVDTVKKAAAKVSTRGVEVAKRAGTRGARALVETTVAAVETVDKIQEKLGRRPSKARAAEEPVTGRAAGQAAVPKPVTRASGTTGRASTRQATSTRGLKDVAAVKAPTAKSREAISKKSRRTTTEALPVALREAGRKTMPGTAPKRSKAAKKPGFKVKRGQKHRHTGR